MASTLEMDMWRYASNLVVASKLEIFASHKMTMYASKE